MKLQEIERLRAIAVLMVLVAHTIPRGYLGMFEHPRTGVDLFFVISGFVVTRSLVRLLPDLGVVEGLDAAFDRSRLALRTFYSRRFFRIVPLAVAVVVLQGLLPLTGANNDLVGGSPADYWREVVAIFTGVYNYAVPNAGYNQFGVFWSLSVEEHFYLLLPVAFLLYRTRSKRIAFSLAGIAFIALVCRTFLDASPSGTASDLYYKLYSSHLRFDALLAGVALSLVLEGTPATPFMPPALIKWVVLPACLALVWAIPLALPENAYLHQGLTATWFLCAILVGYASLDRGYIFEVPLLGTALQYVGARSYAIYLLHIPLSRLDGIVGKYHPLYTKFCNNHSWIHWFLFVLEVIAVAEVTWRVIEWPMQKLGRRLGDTSAPPWTPSRRTRILAVVSAAALVLLYFHHWIGRHFGRTNLALGRPVTTSSVLADQPDRQELTNGVLESARGTHTEREEHAWVMIDLGQPMPVGSIVTYNRADGWEDEVLPLTLETSEDGERFTAVGRRTALFSQWFPWQLSLPGVTARYIRYTAKQGGYICLAESEVYAP